MKNKNSLNEVDRAIHAAARELGFRHKRVTFKQAERKLFSLYAAGPRLTPSREREHQAYFQAVVKPYVDFAMLIDRVEGIRTEMTTRSRRLAEIRNEAHELVAVVDARTALVRDQMDGLR
jgi:hypothetical protein